MIRTFALWITFIAALPLAGAALTLPQGATRIFDDTSALDSYALPVAAFDGRTVPSRIVEGRVERTTWRVPPSGATSLEILAPMRDTLRDEGYDILLDCADRVCGGFDFRFGIEVVETPDMYVNLRDFRFLSAMRGASEAITLLVSTSPTAVYIQQIRVSPPPGRD